MWKSNLNEVRAIPNSISLKGWLGFGIEADKSVHLYLSTRGFELCNTLQNVNAFKPQSDERGHACNFFFRWSIAQWLSFHLKPNRL